MLITHRLTNVISVLLTYCGLSIRNNTMTRQVVLKCLCLFVCCLWETNCHLFDDLSIIKILFGKKKLAMFFSLKLASVGNSVNKMLWTPGLINEAWQIMNSHTLYTPIKGWYLHTLVFWASFTVTVSYNGCFFSKLCF